MTILKTGFVASLPAIAIYLFIVGDIRRVSLHTSLIRQ